MAVVLVLTEINIYCVIKKDLTENLYIYIIKLTYGHIFSGMISMLGLGVPIP